MLKVIANADYGVGGASDDEGNRPIRDTGIVPSRPSFMLCEVLRLTMYSNPEVPNSPPFEPGPTGIRGHQTRLFACTMLLRMRMMRWRIPRWRKVWSARACSTRR